MIQPITKNGGPTTIDQIVDAIRNFQERRPRAGGVEMIKLIEHMVSLYRGLGEVLLSADTTKRDFQVRALYQMRLISKDADDRDFEALGRYRILYPRASR